jgi:hypothetical protein
VTCCPVSCLPEKQYSKIRKLCRHQKAAEFFCVITREKGKTFPEKNDLRGSLKE